MSEYPNSAASSSESVPPTPPFTVEAVETLLRRWFKMYDWSKRESAAINDFILTIREGVAEDLNAHRAAAPVASVPETKAAEDIDRFGFVRCVKCSGSGSVCENDCSRCGGDGIEPVASVPEERTGEPSEDHSGVLWSFARYCAQTGAASERLANAESYEHFSALLDALARMLEAADIPSARKLRALLAASAARVPAEQTSDEVVAPLRCPKCESDDVRALTLIDRSDVSECLDCRHVAATREFAQPTLASETDFDAFVAWARDRACSYDDNEVIRKGVAALRSQRERADSAERERDAARKLSHATREERDGFLAELSSLRSSAERDAARWAWLEANRPRVLPCNPAPWWGIDTDPTAMEYAACRQSLREAIDAAMSAAASLPSPDTTGESNGEA